MSIKAAVFDIGQTLAYYPFPLNWSALYRPAFESVAAKNGFTLSEEEFAHAGAVLAKYNTRINPREREVSSDTIFTEILAGTRIPSACLDAVRNDFYSFFRRKVSIYDDVPGTLKALKTGGILTGTLSDVAYGMDNEFALADIADVLEYIDFPFTSNDAGWRKPCRKGLEMLAERMGVRPSEIVFTGDEKKDIECAKNAGAFAVLVNRSGEEKRFGQDCTVKSLAELTDLIESSQH